MSRADPIAGDRARWVQRLRRLLLPTYDRIFVEGLLRRVEVRGCHAVIDEAERARVARIEREMGS